MTTCAWLECSIKMLYDKKTPNLFDLSKKLNRFKSILSAMYVELWV